jgi:uncharacterized membrane protein YqjE
MLAARGLSTLTVLGNRRVRMVFRWHSIATIVVLLVFGPLTSANTSSTGAPQPAT